MNFDVADVANAIPVDSISCLKYQEEEMGLDFCVSLTFCAGGSNVCGCTIEVGNEKCDLCEICGDATLDSMAEESASARIDCDNIMPGESTNGECMAIDDAGNGGLMQTNDGKCSATPATSSVRVAFFGTVILIFLAYLW
jgi:hypothetical protein